MQAFVHIVIASIGFFVIGAALGSWVMRDPNPDIIWIGPATLFFFAPSVFAGVFLYDWFITWIK